jgi:phosphinothricin acetyltransferase
MIVREALPADAAAVQAIYAHHVLNGWGTFEEVPPTTAQIAERMAAVQGRGLPYRVVEDAGAVRSFAYAAPFRPRAAYRFTIEDSVYVAPDGQRRGYGRAALGAVMAECQRLGFHQMVAVIGGADNAGSIGLHTALGFRRTGVLPGVGFKAGRWVDVVHMQKALNGGAATPAPLGLGSVLNRG